MKVIAFLVMFLVLKPMCFIGKLIKLPCEDWR